MSDVGCNGSVIAGARSDIIPGMEEPPFTLIEMRAIDQAFEDAQAEAKDREERMPSSAAALRGRAENLIRVRKKILAALPE